MHLMHALHELNDYLNRMFLHACSTSQIQPLDAGIIKIFKANYLNNLTDNYCEQVDDNEIKELKCPDLKQCMYMVIDAWRRVSEETIINCWDSCKILNCKEDEMMA